MSSASSGPIRAVAKFFFEGDRKFFVKGITYGPFKPDAEGHYLGPRDQVERDLAQMRESWLERRPDLSRPASLVFGLLRGGGNARPDHAAVGETCGVPAPESARGQIVADGPQQAVATNRGHPAIFGYLVGNEISSTMVRWLGVRRVTEFVEHLIRVGRETDPNVLFSYASYPPTEFLLPQNSDFSCFNVYLHNQRDFERYLLRLQNLSEDRPLILGEFGMDTIRHTEDEQAEMLGWHVDSVVKCGLAGTIFFTWTDEWFTGDQEITDWAFGIVTRAREPKKSFHLCATKLGQDNAALPHRPLPSLSVCLRHRLLLQRGKNAGRMPGVVRQDRLSQLRSHPGRRRLDRRHARNRRPLSERSLLSSNQSRAEPRAELTAPRSRRARSLPTPTRTAWPIPIGSIIS